MGANAEAGEARSDRETVRRTVSTLVQRCKAPAIKSTLFHHVVTSYISLVAIFYIIFKNHHGTHAAAPPFPQKAHAFRGPRYLFLFLYKQSGFGPLMGANAEAGEARSDRETVRRTVSTLVQRCKAPAIKSTLFHHVVTSYISLVAIFLYHF